MAVITLKGREVPLLYTTYEMKLIQEEIGPLGSLQYRLLGKKQGDDDSDENDIGGPDQLNVLAKMIRILGNAGLEEAGEEPDLTDKKILRAMKPSDIVPAINAVSSAMVEAMRSEIPEKKPGGPVDVTLEDMKKKDEKDG